MNVAAEAREAALPIEMKNEVVTVDEATSALMIGAQWVLVDTVDLPLVTPFTWSITKGKSGPAYARAYVGGGRAAGKYARMHRLLLRPEPHEDVDHINGDGLDNRRANLRAISRAENLINTGAFKTNKAGARGVCWYPAYAKWRAYITVAKKMKTLGYFATKEAAIDARRRAEDEFYPDANRRRG